MKGGPQSKVGWMIYGPSPFFHAMHLQVMGT